MGMGTERHSWTQRDIERHRHREKKRYTFTDKKRHRNGHRETRA